VKRRFVSLSGPYFRRRDVADTEEIEIFHRNITGNFLPLVNKNILKIGVSL